MPTALPPFPSVSTDAAVQAAQQPAAEGYGDYMHQPNGAVDMPSDINVEEARYVLWPDAECSAVLPLVQALLQGMT